jgi:SagB-type dehydrogenase family enzyme
MSTKGKIALLILIVLLAVTILYLIWPKSYTSETRAVISTVKLPNPQITGSTSVEQAINDRRSVRRYTSQSLTLQDVSQLMWAAQGITNTTTGFRAAPSAGATYPLEIYILVGNGSVNGLNKGLYHYNPYNNTLEQILGNDARPALSQAANGQPWVEQAPVDIIITGNYQKMIDKYKDETLSTRFVNMEAGHVGENIYLEAEARGLVTVALGSFKDDQVHQVLTIPANENTLYIFPVGHSAL